MLHSVAGAAWLEASELRPEDRASLVTLIDQNLSLIDLNLRSRSMPQRCNIRPVRHEVYGKTEEGRSMPPVFSALGHLGAHHHGCPPPTTHPHPTRPPSPPLSVPCDQGRLKMTRGDVERWPRGRSSDQVSYPKARNVLTNQKIYWKQLKFQSQETCNCNWMIVITIITRKSTLWYDLGKKTCPGKRTKKLGVRGHLGAEHLSILPFSYPKSVLNSEKRIKFRSANKQLYLFSGMTLQQFPPICQAYSLNTHHIRPPKKNTQERASANSESN